MEVASIQAVNLTGEGIRVDVQSDRACVVGEGGGDGIVDMVRATLFLKVDEPVPAVKENCSINPTGTSREAMQGSVVSHVENLDISFIIDFDYGQLSIAAEIDAWKSVSLGNEVSGEGMVKDEVSVCDAVDMNLGPLAPG